MQSPNIMDVPLPDNNFNTHIPVVLQDEDKQEHDESNKLSKSSTRLKYAPIFSRAELSVFTTIILLGTLSLQISQGIHFNPDK